MAHFNFGLFILCLDMASNESRDCLTVAVHHRQFISMRQRAP